MKMVYRLTNVGARRFSGEVTVERETELLREVKKHCASRRIEISWDEEETKRRGVVTAGMHVAGKIEFVRFENQAA